MALSIQTAYCVIKNQHFDNVQLARDDSNCFQMVEKSVTSKVDDDEICKLIRKHQSGLKHIGISGCICVLLPTISDHTTLKNITYELFETIGNTPNLDIFLYPYGEASFLMALARVQREIQAAKPIWILALNAERLDEVDSNDSFILVACKEQPSGLTSGTVRIDLTALDQETAIEKVVAQLGVSSQKHISDLVLTIDGEEPTWLHCLSGLDPWINTSSQYQFSNFKFGSLGACNGLLKALNLYHQQKLRPNLAFQALQLDIEPNGYVAGTLFGWSND